MSDIFRIIDRIHIEGRGTIYTTTIPKGANLHISDHLFDLNGNSFKVKGLEIREIFISDIPLHERPVDILLESADKTEPDGDILVGGQLEISFLFCNHPLYPRKVDEDYKEEHRVAGLSHSCALFSYEDLEKGKLSLYGDEITGLAVYRGWMMKPRMYSDFYNQLEERGIILINTPKEYERYHLLPGWYKEFENETANSVWTVGNCMQDVFYISKELEGSYIVKDYVKSRKHEWHDACFIENVRDQAAVNRVVGNFIERQGADLVGGIVLRKYENLRQNSFHKQSKMPLSEEYRVFVYAGKILAVDNYWSGASDIKFSAQEYRWIESIASRVKSNFVTVDLARKEDGTLIIMEFGDGQVSGLQQVAAETFYGAFLRKYMK